MSRKNSEKARKDLAELIYKYENAKEEERQLYLDSDQIARIADWYIVASRYRQAQEAIDYGFQLHPGNTDLLIEQAYLCLDTEGPEKAQEVVDKIIETQNYEVKILKAELALAEELAEVANHILYTIEDTDDLAVLMDIIYIFLDWAQPAAATEWVEKGRKLYGEEEDFLIAEADYLTATHQLEEAIVTYNKLIDIAAYDPSYWTGLGKVHLLKGDMAKALECCDFALAADENYGEAYVYRAHCYFYFSNLEKTIENFEKAREYKAIPDSLAYMFIGMAYSSVDNWEKVAEYNEKIIQLFEEDKINTLPLMIEVYTTKAYAVAKQGRYKEAHQLCKKAKAIDSKSHLIYLTEGKIYLFEQAEEKAAKAFQKAVKLAPVVEDVCYMIATTYADFEYIDEAKEYYEKVYEVDPDYEEVKERLAIICIVSGDYDDFFKYNNECSNPIKAQAVEEMLERPDIRTIDKLAIREMVERLREKEEKEEAEKNNQSN